MKKTFLLLFIPVFVFFKGSAQTLFTYGKYSVDAKEFLRAFNKNNNQQAGSKSAAIKEYLQLYINSRLRIREAYDRRYDTLPQVNAEVENLRKQIAENYMNDPQLTPRLQREAFERSLKDIHVAHIFISFTNRDEPDTAQARVKKEIVLGKLKAGEDFLKLAEEYSDDPAVKKNKGDLGFITVFTLPYEFENAIYSTPAGRNSAVITSKAGYHIFKNLGERKALGKIKAKQILLAIPPNSGDVLKKEISLRADSIYKAIINGADFGTLATRYSNDYITAANKGLMPDISVGEYDPGFESKVFGILKDGELTKPFETAHGWHIVQRISRVPVITDSSDSKNKQELLQRIMTDSRWKSSKDFIYKKVMAKPGIKKFNYDERSAWATADSLVLLVPVKAPAKLLDLSTQLFKIGDSTYTLGNFISYAPMNRFNLNGSVKPWPQVLDEYTRMIAAKYYEDNLETYSEEFRNQMAEFRDGNIFFEIMQAEVWNKAQNDTASLKDLYEKNKSKYTWKNYVDAVMFYCPDEATAKMVYEEVKKDPGAWKSIAEKYSDKMIADSSRFEWDQLTFNNQVPKAGTIIPPIVNSNDNSASFAYILNVSSQPSQRTFAEARGMLVNDYQVLIENQWTEQLRRKYPVKVNEKVLQEISK